MKTMLLLFVAIMPLYINAMEINYEHFFKLCRVGNLKAVKKFTQQNPTLDINYQTKDHGTTALLHAATWWKWDVVWYLLECGADKMIKDNYGQSIFSKSLSYETVKAFKKLLRLYSSAEINILCKSIPLRRNHNNEIDLNYSIGIHAQSVLDGKNKLESTSGTGCTALHNACIYEQIPIIVILLNRGASLEKKRVNDSSTSYDYLNRFNRKCTLFAAREALNDGPCIPDAALLSAILDNAFDIDCARLIKQRYVEETLKEIDFFETPQARIWKYVCADACKVAKIERLDEKTNQPDEKRSLAALLLLPQKALTEVNIQLAFGREVEKYSD